jgi:hypothetical protein
MTNERSQDGPIEVDASGSSHCSDAVEFVEWKPRYVIDRRELEFVNRVIPRERFVEYEPRDLDWMIPLGMAPEIVIDQALMDRAAKILAKRFERECMRPLWANQRPWIPGQD